MLARQLLTCIMAAMVAMTISQNLTDMVPEYFYPFGPSLGDGIAPVNDDGSTGEVNILIPFPYFDQLHSSLYVNTNGGISFLVEVSQFTPDPFPLGDNRRLITPFWADVDTTRNYGRVYWRETQEAAILDRCTNDVRSSFVDQSRFQAVWALIVTWHNVTYYGGSSTTSINSFQAILITNGRHSFAVFNYGDITWTFGTASSGVHAQAGFNAGDSVRFFTIPGSRTAEIADVETTSNVGQPGRWIFRVDEASVVAGGCNTAGTLAVGPRFSSFLGGKKVTIAGPCFNTTSDDVVCKFSNITVPGVILDGTHASCIVPMTMRLGRTPFNVSIDGGRTYNYTGIFWLVERDTDHYIRLEDELAWKRGGLYDQLIIRWNYDSLNSSSVDVNFVIFSKQGTEEVATQVVSLYPGAPNTGVLALSDRLRYAGNLRAATFGAIRVTEKLPTNRTAQSIWSEIHSAEWYTNRLIHELTLRNLNSKRRKRNVVDWTNDLLDSIKDKVDRTASDMKQAVSDKIEEIKEDVFGGLCDDWFENESSSPPDFDEVGPAPCTLDQARRDPNFVPDPACNMGEGCVFHPGAHHCVRSAEASASGGSQQACYDRDGSLLAYENGGGTYDKSHASGRFWPAPVVIPYVEHFLDDVVPYEYCCDLSSNCDKYGQMRPTDDCDGYEEPVPAWTSGDPHVKTLDGIDYTFNGIGEYILLDIGDGSFVIQARAEQAVHPTLGAIGATVWTAVAMKGRNSDKVQLSVSERLGLEVLVNGEPETFEDLPSLQYQGVLIEEKEQSKNFTVKFNNGVSIQVFQESGAMSFLPVLTPANKGKTRGLLGVWDGNTTNDFTAPDGTIVPHNATSRQIYDDFGQKWRTTADESLFTYPMGRDHASYQEPLFIPTFEPPTTDPEIAEKAMNICGENFQCRFDFILTGNEQIAVATMTSSEEYVVVLEQVKQVITCGFPEVPSNGRGNVTNGPAGALVMFECDDGYELKGSESRECLQTGTWSGIQTQCDLIPSGSARQIGAATFPLLIMSALLALLGHH